MRTLLNNVYSPITRIGSVLQSPLLLVIRLYWGWQFLQSGYGKLGNIPKVVEFFTSIEIPAPTFAAYFVGSLELVAGALLIIGLASRLAALSLAITMVMAFVVADREALLSVFSDPSKFTSATPFLFLFASLIILAFGPGKFSLDAFINKKSS